MKILIFCKLFELFIINNVRYLIVIFKSLKYILGKIWNVLVFKVFYVMLYL